MVKVLIFRTDRIGDLIVSSPAIFTISQYFKNAEITLITSSKNTLYAKNLNIFYKVIQFPRSGLINKIKFFKEIYKNKFDYILILDGKERSILVSSLIRANKKVALTNKIKLYYNLLNIKFFKDDEKTNLSIIFQQMLDHCQIKTKIDNYNFLNQKKDNNFSRNLPIKDFLQIHLDEKWIKSLYIGTYTNINPKCIDFVNFLESLNKVNNIIITTGLVKFNLISELKSKYFNKISEKVYVKKYETKSIYLVFEPSFDDLESLLRNAKILIACHGAIIHASNSFNVKKIDILEKAKVNFYKRFTSYLKNYHVVYRDDFMRLKEDIIKQIM